MLDLAIGRDKVDFAVTTETALSSGESVQQFAVGRAALMAAKLLPAAALALRLPVVGETRGVRLSPRIRFMEFAPSDPRPADG